MVKPKFEDCIKEIDKEIYKRKSRWTLTAIAWMDFDDVAQILRLHIYKKWSFYNPEKPLSHWINKIISNQIANLIRNTYSNYARPCLHCAAAEPNDLCSLFSKQCNACPIYARWEKKKKPAYDTKLPVSLENHTQEVFNVAEPSINFDSALGELHKKMEKVLKPRHWQVYQLLYLESKNHKQIADIMGFELTKLRNRNRYKQIENIEKRIEKLAREILNKEGIEYAQPQ